MSNVPEPIQEGATIVPNAERWIEERRSIHHQLMVHRNPPVRITQEQADAEQAERVARATNNAPVDPASLAETPAGASVLAIVIGDATGLRWRGRARTVRQRLWRALTGR